MGRFRCRFRGLFLVFLDQTADRIARFCTFADPILGAIELERAIVTRFLRIVGADDLDELPVPRAAFIGHDNFVIGAIQRAFSS